MLATRPVSGNAHVATPEPDRRARDQERILNALGEPLLLIGANRRIAFMNDAALEAFGSDMTGRNVTRAVRHPDVMEALDEVLTGRRSAQATATVDRPAVTYRVTVTALEGAALEGRNARDRFGADRPVAVMGFNDVSHMIRAEAMRSDFVANVSHELRSPLTALTGFIETLGGAARDDAEARDRFLSIMAREADRMDRLIDDLLSLSRVEQDERVRPRGRVDVSGVLERTVAMLGPKAADADKRVELAMEAERTTVAGDEDQLVQVFQNLIENAVKYSRSGTPVQVTAVNEAGVPGFAGIVLTVTVTDHGEGIAPEHLPRLTERFYRVDTGRSRAMGGTGLGLAIVKHILNRHRGRLTIRSTLGEGSRFTVQLPLAD